MADDIREELTESFADSEYRHAYAASFLNTSIAAQIKALRDARNWTQEELGSRAGMRQESICRLENVNYSGWSINSLRRLAEAFDLALVVKFESFGNLLQDIVSLNKETLIRPSFADDPAFQEREQQAPSAGDKLAQVYFPGNPINSRLRIAK